MIKGYDLFFKRLETNNATSKTISQYEKHINEFLNFFNIETIEDLDSLDKIRVLEYTDYMESKGYSPNTLKCRYAYISSFLNYLHSDDKYSLGILNTNISQWLIPPNPQQDIVQVTFTAKECRQIMETTRDITDKTIISLFLTTGMRNQELRMLKIDDIKLGEDGYCISILGKGNKIRNLPLKDEIYELVQEYLNSKWRKHDGEYVFNSAPNKPYTGFGMSKRIKNIFRNAYENYIISEEKYEHATAHTCRRTLATSLIESDVPLPVVKEILGHASINTTMRYIKPTETGQRNALAKLKY